MRAYFFLFLIIHAPESVMSSPGFSGKLINRIDKDYQEMFLKFFQFHSKCFIIFPRKSQRLSIY